MTDKTGPRLMILDAALSDAEHFYRAADDVLSEMDAADRAAGIVRVDTGDEALVATPLLDRILFIGGPGEGIPDLRDDVGKFVLMGSPQEFVDAIFATLREAS